VGRRELGNHDRPGATLTNQGILALPIVSQFENFYVLTGGGSVVNAGAIELSGPPNGSAGELRLDGVTLNNLAGATFQTQIS
jgi:hypothetical protein